MTIDLFNDYILVIAMVVLFALGFLAGQRR